LEGLILAQTANSLITGDFSGKDTDNKSFDNEKILILFY
jgi:hypothetical protein